jgi:drug/metabolite transporter (DMT)-like permease
LPSSLSGLLIATVPLIAVTLAVLTGHQDRMETREIMGLVIGLVGVGVLLGLDAGRRDLGSVALVGLVAVGYATGPLLASRYMGHLSSLALAAVTMALVAVAYLPIAIWQRPASPPPGQAVASIVVLGVVCTALAFVAFFELIKEIGSTRATVISFVNPAVAVVLGVALLGEPFKLSTAIGFALILAGSWMPTAAGRAPSPRPHPAGVDYE